MKSYAVIGLGRFGSRLAQNLYKYNQDVLAIDTNEDNVEAVANGVTRAATADGRDPDILRELGVQDCDCAIVAVGSDLAASVLITMNLKNLGLPKVICKAFDEIHRNILLKLGADRVIIPEHVVADRVASTLAMPNILESIELSDKYGIVECNPPKSWVGKSLRDLAVRTKYGINIIAIRNGDKIDVSPSADYPVSADSILVLLGEYDDLDKVERIK